MADWYRTKEYDKERFKQLNPLAKGMVKLGQTLTGGRATAAGEEFRKKNETLANAVYYTPHGQWYAGTVTQNERAADNVRQSGGQLYTTTPQTLDERKEAVGVPEILPIDWNFVEIDDKLSGGLKGFGIGTVVAGVIAVVVVLYLLVRGSVGLHVVGTK